MSGPKPESVELTPAQVHELHLVALGDDQRLAARERIVLFAAEGLSNAEIARREAIPDVTARMWRGRFIRGGVAGLTPCARAGRRPTSNSPPKSTPS